MSKNSILNELDLPCEVREQLAIVDKSLGYLVFILVSVLLSYYTTRVQREQLICSVTQDDSCSCLPDIFPIQITSSLLALAALIFFFLTADKANQQTNVDCVKQKSNHSSYISSLLVLVAAVMRFSNILFVKRCDGFGLDENVEAFPV